METKKGSHFCWAALIGDWHAWLPSRGTVLLAVLVVSAFFFANGVGAFPGSAPKAASAQVVSYQGRLTDASAVPLSGTYSMVFRLYSVATGGTALWTEQWTGANSVQVSNGLFYVMLGSVTAIPQSVITGNSTLYLGITVGTDSEMTPRVQLGSAPYAWTVPDGSVTTAKLAAGAVTQSFSVPPNGYTDSTSSTTPVDMAGRSITLTTTGGPVLVIFSGSHTAQTPAGEALIGVGGYWQIVRDNSVVVAFNTKGFSQWEWATTTLFGVDTPPAGSHTYKVQWRVSQGTLLAGAGVYSENFAVIEFKR